MADPISATVTAIATFAASTATAAATAVGLSAGITAGIGNFILAATPYLLTTVATSAVTALLAPSVDIEGSPTTWRADPNAGIPFVIGERAVAGKIVHRDEYGEDNRYQSIVTVLSGAGPIQALDDFQAAETSITFGANGIATNGGNFASNMWLQTSLGDQPQSTALQQTGLPGGSPGIQGWGASSKISGKAHTFLTLRQDSKNETYPAGVPRVLHVVRGIKFYDPRLDSTYPGGSGAHRLNDRSTWAYSENPHIAALNWVLGLYENDILVGGVGAAFEGVDVAAFVEGANICDANGWVVSAVPTSKDSKFQVLEALLQAGGARYVSNEGLISCINRTTKTSVATITADDTAGPISLNFNADRLTAVNSITPRCVQENQDWEITDQPEVTEASYVTADGGKRREAIDYPYVSIKADGTNDDQVAQLAAYDLVYSRENIAGRIPLKPHLNHVGPGDVITVSDPNDQLQLNGVTLQVVTRSFDFQQNITVVEVVSETAANHTYALGLTNTPPAAQGLTQGNIYTVEPPDAGEWSVAAASGNSPTLIVTNTVVSTPAPAFEVQIKPTAGSDWSVYGQFPAQVDRVEITGLEPNTSYDVRVTAISDYGVISDPTSIGSATTGGLAATEIVSGSDLDTSITDIENEIAAAADALSSGSTTLDQATEQARTDIESGVARTNRALAEVAFGLSEIQSGQNAATDENALRRVEISTLEVSVGTDDGDGTLFARAASLEATVVNLDDNKAEASRVSTLEAQVGTDDSGGDLFSRVATNESAVSNLDDNKAEASRVSTLEAQVGTDDSGGALFGRVAANTASITDLDTVTAEADRAQTRRLSRALAEVAANSAEAISATNIVVDETRAEATRTRTLEAQVGTDDGSGTLFSRVATNESAVSNLDDNKAEASRVSTLEAQVGTDDSGGALFGRVAANTASITDLDTVTAEADRAQARRLSRALAEVAANSAQAISATNVVVDDQRSEVTRTTQLRSEFDDVSADVSVLASAYTDGAGNALASFSVVTAASGSNPAIVQLKSGDGASDAALVADRVMLGNLGTGEDEVRPVFLAQNGEALFNEQITIYDDIATPTTAVILGPDIGTDGLTLWAGAASDASSPTLANAQLALGASAGARVNGTILIDGYEVNRLFTSSPSSTRAIIDSDSAGRVICRADIEGVRNLNQWTLIGSNIAFGSPGTGTMGTGDIAIFRFRVFATGPDASPVAENGNFGSLGVTAKQIGGSWDIHLSDTGTISVKSAYISGNPTISVDDFIEEIEQTNVRYTDTGDCYLYFVGLWVSTDAVDSAGITLPFTTSTEIAMTNLLNRNTGT